MKRVEINYIAEACAFCIFYLLVVYIIMMTLMVDETHFKITKEVCWDESVINQTLANEVYSLDVSRGTLIGTYIKYDCEILREHEIAYPPCSEIDDAINILNAKIREISNEISENKVIEQTCKEVEVEEIEYEYKECLLQHEITIIWDKDGKTKRFDESSCKPLSKKDLTIEWLATECECLRWDEEYGLTKDEEISCSEFPLGCFFEYCQKYQCGKYKVGVLK